MLPSCWTHCVTLSYDLDLGFSRSNLEKSCNDQCQRSQWVGRSLRWCHPSVTLGTAYPQVAVVNWLLSKDAVSHGASSMSSCLSSPPAHFPSPPEEELTIHVSGAPCSMQAKSGPQPYLTCITCNAMTELWFAGWDVRCHHQGPRQHAGSLEEDAAWWSGNCTRHPLTQMAWPCRM